MNVLTNRNLYELTLWMDKRYHKTKKLEATKATVANVAAAELGFKITEGNIMGVCKTLDIKAATTTGQRAGRTVLEELQAKVLVLEGRVTALENMQEIL